MSDPRLTPANERVAHTSLQGRVKAARFSDGQWHQVIAPSAPILDAPGGARLRELLLGEEFCVLDTHDGACFGFGERDGYVGHVPEDMLGTPQPVSHEISAIRSYAKQVGSLKDTGPHVLLSRGARLNIRDSEGAWARFRLGTRDMFVPRMHIRPIGQHDRDPASVAQMYLGTPYLWGGNSALGIDCSGLVQAALLACGMTCPGDSDQQQASLGTPLAANSAYQRADLLFWKGHVAMVLDEAHLIHATANAMAVAIEDIGATIARIKAAGDGPLLAHKRL